MSRPERVTPHDCAYCVFCKHSPHKEDCPPYMTPEEQKRMEIEDRLRDEIANHGDC